MINILICDIENNYRGVFRINSLPELAQDVVIGSDVKDFLENCIDEETQGIIYSLNNIDKAKAIVNRLNYAGCKCEVILCSDEDVSFEDFSFIGFDVCADDYYFSPLGEGLIDCNVSKDKRIFYDGFFEPLDFGVLSQYNNDLNEFGLFESEKSALEIADYCNWLYERDSGILSQSKDFRAVKIYALK